jgi:hypothetical protein
VFLVDVRTEKDGTAGLPAHLPVLDAAGSHTQHDCHLRQQVFRHQHQHRRHTDKNKRKFSSYLRKIQIGAVAKSLYDEGLPNI